ncbi:hypothetical protein J671_3377 [Acinetobacter sp. 1130196]|nr:hypothetical protein J671_3377 [Acinetobacter sp. 1130196]
MNKGLETKKHFDSVEESTTIADDMIEKIADKVVERLKEQK